MHAIRSWWSERRARLLPGLAMMLLAAGTAAEPPSPRLSPSTQAAIHAGAEGPVIIAHRGASALRPEHTLAAYAKAIEDGADFIEPDLVMTRDGVLVARHENEIGTTTDVARHPEFADRRTRRLVDGVEVDGWFVEDFRFDELRRLRAVERLPDLRGTAYDGRFVVPSLGEIIAYTAQAAARHGRTIGLVPEIKHSSHFHAHGLDPEAALIAALRAHPYTRQAPLGIQSFEVGNLKRLRGWLDELGAKNVFLVQLLGAPGQVPADLAAAGTALSYGQMLTPAGLAGIAAYADVLAPHVRYVQPLADDGGLAETTGLVALAHAAGLAVHVWTLRPENHFLPPALRCGDDPSARCPGGSRAEAAALAAAGVDALFTDDPGALVRR